MVVILTRGFDLSLGASVSAISVASALVMTGLDAGTSRPGSSYWRDWLPDSGWAFSSGYSTADHILARHHPFVVTLGSLNICLGLATTISGGRPVFNVPDPFSSLLYNGKLIPGVPVPVVLAAAACVLLYFLSIARCSAEPLFDRQ